MINKHQHVKVFGSALDPNDNELKILAKCNYINKVAQSLIDRDEDYLDPYDGLLKFSKILPEVEFIKLGKFFVSSWLTPKPDVSDFNAIQAINFQRFLNDGGSLEYAKDLQEYVRRFVIPDIPLMIGVDHSLTGGVLGMLAKKYGAVNTLVVIFDAHFDAIPASLSKRFIEYAKENQIESNIVNQLEYSEENVKIRDSYTCASFLDHLIRDKIVHPENLIIFGCQDYPTEDLKAVEDPRVKDYVEYYLSFEKKGVKFVPASKDTDQMIIRLKDILMSISTPYIYISLDVDVSMFQEVLAARFMNAIGIEKSIIIEAAKQIKQYMSIRNCGLIGMDIMEIETQLLGKEFKKAGKTDRTVELVDDFLDQFF